MFLFEVHFQRFFADTDQITVNKSKNKIKMNKFLLKQEILKWNSCCCSNIYTADAAKTMTDKL